MKSKTTIFAIGLFCIIATVLGALLLSGIDRSQLQGWLQQMGMWAPALYILVYSIATICILPSTPLNLTGGAIFGAVWGTVWTSIAAILAAILSFAFSRTIGRKLVEQRLAGRWESIDLEMQQGGFFYMFAIRLLPLIPYGIVNFAAGLTAIKFRDYFLGTLLGTVPGILPFVIMGAGLTALKQGDVLPILVGLALTGMLVGTATWYRRRARKS
ncbi:TVP38/TMEM64 family protein [Chamaesiphon sp.]|uniref:TVP38/TMEM64 family protein n=1 Tax=Chamaesiphon sp. TaxID=2814140 RepID=UPI003593BBAB